MADEAFADLMLANLSYDILWRDPRFWRFSDTVAKLDARYDEVRALWYAPLVAELRVKVFGNEAAPLQHDTTAQPSSTKPSLDALYCLGLGQPSQDGRAPRHMFERGHLTHPAPYCWQSMTQLVFCEAIRDVLSERYELGPCIMQDQVFKPLDEEFLEKHGFVVMDSRQHEAERSITTNSVLFAPCLPNNVIAPIMATVAPRFYIGCWDPRRWYRCNLPEEKQIEERLKLETYCEKHTNTDTPIEFMPMEPYDIWRPKSDGIVVPASEF